MTRPVNLVSEAPAETPPALLSVEDLRVVFPRPTGAFRRRRAPAPAVDGVSLTILPGETLGLVGESGCGKTTIGRAVLRLIPPGTAEISGRVCFEGRDISRAAPSALRELRRRMQIIFQDPAGSLNPRMTVLETLAEPLVVHGEVRATGRAAREEIRSRVHSLLERCGMPRQAADRYPHEFSGGQRQRIAIARALALSPRFIVCDEPTSALDVSVQAQILNLLTDLQQDLGLSYLFISHDMAVIQHMCRRIGVMYRGRIVEYGDRDQVLCEPRHDYTRSLLAASRLEVA